jgi:hypothetical protein
MENVQQAEERARQQEQQQAEQRKQLKRLEQEALGQGMSTELYEQHSKLLERLDLLRRCRRHNIIQAQIQIAKDNLDSVQLKSLVDMRTSLNLPNGAVEDTNDIVSKLVSFKDALSAYYNSYTEDPNFSVESSQRTADWIKAFGSLLKSLNSKQDHKSVIETLDAFLTTIDSFSKPVNYSLPVPSAAKVVVDITEDKQTPDSRNFA